MTPSALRRGDVVWTRFEGKRRPGAVLTRDSAIPLLSRVMVAPITTTIRGAPTEVLLEQGDGMQQRSVIALDNIQTIPKGALGARITTLSPERLDEVCEAVGFALGC